MSGASAGPTKFLIASPKVVMSAQEAPLRIQRAQHFELLVGGRLGRLDARRLEQGETGVLSDRVGRDPGVGGLDPHAPRLGVEAEDPERGDDARDAAEQEPGGAARAVAAKPRGARDEIHALDEAALLVRG